MAENKADMSAAAKKAWDTRREKYGPSGLSAKAKPEAEEVEEEPGAKEGYFCDYCGAGPFEHSWEKATHVRNCEKAKVT